jgi:phage/plasmid-like protein (TIGR03299 family)
MAYAGQTPWHGLGFKVSNDLTPQEMLVAAKLDWTVEKRPLYMPSGDGSKWLPVEDKFALTRNSDEAVFSIVGKDWKETQNETTLDFFTKWVKAGHMQMETAGSLAGGHYVWALARINTTFALSGPGKKRQADDEVNGYLLLMQPHMWGYASTAALTPVRVVCWNTLNYALGAGLKGKSGQIFRLRHSKAFDEKAAAQAELALGLSIKQMTEFKEAATLLASKRASAEETKSYFFEVTKFDPEKAKLDKDGEQKQPKLLQKIMAALDFAPGQQMGSAKGTWWGAYNAVSYVVDHEVGRERATALQSAWVGPNATLKRHAFKLALDKAA